MIRPSLSLPQRESDCCCCCCWRNHNSDFYFRYIFREGTLESECRTTIPISKGKEILDHYVSPLEGTRFRQKKLREGWCFDCDCQRCCDPTELQTNFSSAICGNCNGQGVRNQLGRRQWQWSAVKRSRKKKFKDNVSRISWHPIPIFLLKRNFVWGEAVGLRVPCRIIVSLRSFHLFPVTL